MIEYLEDAIENDPNEEFPREVRESGNYMHRTGDRILDKWQEEAVSGKPINFDEAFGDPEALKQFEAIKAASRARHQAKMGIVEVPEVEDIHDDYTKDVR